MENKLLDSELFIPNEDLLLEKEIPWAGFWIRVLASIIDGLVMIPIIGLSVFNLISLKNLTLELSLMALIIFYKPLMEYKYGATLGKMACKIKVTNVEFGRITLEQSFLRSSLVIIGQIISIISTIIIYQSADFINSTNWLEIGEIQEPILLQVLDKLSSVIIIVSCIVVAFNSKKQGIHDMIGKTYNIYK